MGIHSFQDLTFGMPEMSLKIKTVLLKANLLFCFSNMMRERVCKPVSINKIPWAIGVFYF